MNPPISLTERLAARAAARAANTTPTENPGDRRLRLLTDCDERIAVLDDLLRGPDGPDHVPAA